MLDAKQRRMVMVDLLKQYSTVDPAARALHETNAGGHARQTKLAAHCIVLEISCNTFSIISVRESSTSPFWVSGTTMIV